ncbi:13707_t:CDS:2 [Funneliformis geosporum]|uniref:rRNA methyltransferase 1, mitochondrial n=1 Tax=Funneliformis geosporum TaxID=1117311 RepID=A0A9W4WSA1_9GLOM|nr:13707_t:CDS:2 [Funneliformis geosporum]
MLTFNSYHALALRSLSSMLTKNITAIYRKAYHQNKRSDLSDFKNSYKNNVKQNIYKGSSMQRKDDFDYLYGLSVVLPALEQKRRKFYRLFVQEGILFRRKESRIIPEKILSLADETNIPIVKTTKDELNKLLKDDRPHQARLNPFLLTSKIEPIKIKHLGKHYNKTYQVIKPFNSLMTLNIPQNGIRPFWLALDQVVDPQVGPLQLFNLIQKVKNSMSFIHFYSAPLSAVTTKASSGALEIMDVYNVDNLTNFLNESSHNGWIIYGAVSNVKNNNNSIKSSISIGELKNPSSQNPIILVIGSEDSCHYHLYIPSPHVNKLEYIDSLNVNAATAVLLQRFLGDKG